MKYLAIVIILLSLSCGSIGLSNFSEPNHKNASHPVYSISTTGFNSNLKILIDASRDGGLWWYPQSAPFNASQNHQGKTLVDYFKNLNLSVTELSSQNIPITYDNLSYYDIVLCFATGQYTQQEINAYHDYVANGGNLFLFADHHNQGNIFNSFGLDFEGINVGGTSLSNFSINPITDGVSTLYYGAGSGLISYPSNTTILAWLPSNAFTDLNDNNVRDAGESYGTPVMGAMNISSGKLVFFGDSNSIESIPQPFTNNTLAYFGKSNIVYTPKNSTSNLLDKNSTSTTTVPVANNSSATISTTPGLTLYILIFTLIVVKIKKKRS